MKVTSLARNAAIMLMLTGCSMTGPSVESSRSAKVPMVITTSAIVADITSAVGGNAVEVRSLIPNGFDTHTYEPKPSELIMLEQADLVVVADAKLNAAVTGLAKLSGDEKRILYLNERAFSADDFVYREAGNGASANPHTWTSPLLVARWLAPLTERIIALAPDRESDIRANARVFSAELAKLDEEIRSTLSTITAERRKLVVYHDAWEYFGREYELRIIGALQAVSYAEPSAGELAKMAEQIRKEGVRTFFGSEVFPSDVLQALEAESGAIYVSDLADDRLPGIPGDANHNYLALMRANLVLLVDGLSR
jgi:ABC-type Zn uptake system ZnuABC Zn-binding protein ZnuA